MNTKSTRKSSVFSINAMIVLFFVVAMALFAAVAKPEVGLALPAFLAGTNLPMLILIWAMAAPFIGLFLNKINPELRNTFYLYSTFVSFLLSVSSYQGAMAEGGLVYEIPKVLGYGVTLKIDPLTFIMIVAASVLWIFCVSYSEEYMKHEGGNLNRFYFWFMLTFAGIMGALLSNDLLFLFLFFEVMYFCCYYLVAHSETPEAVKAALRYLYMGIIGSLSVLVGISVIFYFTRSFSFDTLHDLLQVAWPEHKVMLSSALVAILFGLGIKAAVFPLHIWLPDAHANAPSSGSAVLSGMVIKVYVFAAIRILYKAFGAGIALELGLNNILGPLALFGMIMGSVFALGQTDIKRRLAYSSVAQVGYLLLGMAAFSELGVSATMFHITTHALMKSALFLCAGAVIYQTGKRTIKDFEGIGYKMPITMLVFTIGSLSMVGIPMFNGFISKWNLAMASVQGGKFAYVALIMVSSFLNAMYYLPIVLSAFLKKGAQTDLTYEKDKVPMTMLIPMLLLGAGCLLFGLYPQLIMNIVEKGIVYLYF